MIIDEKAFRETVRSLVKGVIVIVALSILKSIAGSLPGTDVRLGSMPLNSWISIVLSLVIVGFLIKLFHPVKTVVAFYLTAFVKVGKLAGRDKYIGNITAVAANTTLLAFLLSIYAYLQPVILLCNYTFIHINALTTILNIIVLLASIGILLILWKNALPLVDLFSGHISDKVSTLSSSIAYVDCPACGTKNDRDALFCASCGGKMETASSAGPSNKHSCPKCAAENPPGAKFCCKCGSSI